MKKSTCILFFALASFIVGVPSYAAEFEISAGVGMLNGDMTYRIGYPVHWVNFGTDEGYFPFSELKFPLDVYMGSVEGSIGFAEKWKVSLGVKKNITDDAGDMEDSDWITESDPGRLDVHSTSETDLDALILDINLQYKYYQTSNWSNFVGLGYLRENFDFDTMLKTQYSPSGLPGYDYVGDGSVSMKYEITYDIPYLEIGTKYDSKKKFSIEASLAYSPFVRIEDKDQHILRNKVNKGDLDGDAIIISLLGRYDFTKKWFITLGIDYMKIKTDKGDMTATFSGADSIFNHTVTEEVESEQLLATLSIGFTW
ncbi:MAG: omptin family outer membrane protease [Deltaproteobacteria bacterium]|nr:omptin family outer membrane protease [Deltaproteobacteria bacterium]